MESTVSITSCPVAAVAAAQPRAAGRLLFVDNLRTVLTIQVIVFHLMITYAGTGSWLYMEGRDDLITGALGAWFITVSQAFFMGLFLLVSAYFVPGAYDRKGAAHFLRDRLIRLGIPLVIYGWVIDPILVYVFQVCTQGTNVSFWRFYTGQYTAEGTILGHRHLWFVETLLIFSLVYAVWRLVVRPQAPTVSAGARFPGTVTIAVVALLLGVAAFFVRVVSPIDSNFRPLNLQFPFFVQYCALFSVGLIAYRRNWLAKMPDAAGRLWLRSAGVLILAWWPLLIGGGALTGGIDPFKGGWRWQALGYAVWESLLGVSLCIGLIYVFRRWANRQGPLGGFLSRHAYGAYIVHSVVIVLAAVAVRNVVAYPLLKWALVSLVAVPLCFVLSSLVRRLPYADRVL
jgi:surface polysaccharide O-acyltransferase-like enzyme